ncbi:MAG TPA: amidohydrolase [Planctomycetota bacterium]|nr:amidohydrolase [Planctomycetota bacterium]
MKRAGFFRASVLALALALTSCAAIVGKSDLAPAEFTAHASLGARGLVERALEGLEGEGAEIVDMHAHVAGTSRDASGCEVSADMRSWRHPWRRIQFFVYLLASGVEDVDHGAEQMVTRLAEVARGKTCILALDHRYRADGSADRAGTSLYVPNDHVLKLCEEHPDQFVPGVSVHPGRKDALEELDRCAARGARIVKWLPNAMNIDPASPACDAFYARLREHGMTLLSHTGEEEALAADSEELGNPLRLRRALDHGVKVIVAHCASLGEAEDLDDPRRPKVPAFELFLRMMSEERYRGLLFGDLSAVAFRNRDASVLRTLLERTDLHERLVDGTDWPLPAIRMLTSTVKLERAGLLTTGERQALDEIFRYDPRLFDLVLKRTVRGRRGERFPASVFLRRREILP